MERLSVHAAEAVVPCAPAILQQTVTFLATEPLQFQLRAIFPADAPTTAVVEGHGLRLRLEQPADGAALGPSCVRLLCEPPLPLSGSCELTAPNGTRLLLVEAVPPVTLPALRPKFVMAEPLGGTEQEPTGWEVGRAGMLYRELIPGRQGGFMIGSQIKILADGPVPDYVRPKPQHLTAARVAFQIIYCLKGWVRLSYEGQGPPFVLRAGDCVLQPPTIRHRVLESGDGLEVVELGCPAEHETLTDPDTTLPVQVSDPPSKGPRTNEYGGQICSMTPLHGPGTLTQQYVHHCKETAQWLRDPQPGDDYEFQDLGLASATNGFGSAVTVRLVGGAPGRQLEGWADAAISGLRHGRGDAEGVAFVYILQGTCRIATPRSTSRAVLLKQSDAVTMGLNDARGGHALQDCSTDLSYLAVVVAPPADPSSKL